MQVRHPLIVLAGVCAAAGFAVGASHDNDVEWSGIGHVSWQDLRPIVPMRNDAFDVQFQAYRGDLTGARVLQDVGGVQTWVSASVIGQRGPYDIWSASLPGTGADDLDYVIEVTDGTDTDYLSPSGMSDGMPASGFALDFVTLAHAPGGSTPVAGGAVFKVWAPTRTTCLVRGEFNGWGTGNPLTKVGEWFVGYVPGATSGQMYKYYFNSTKWNTDPRARQINPADNQNAIIADPLSYAWQHDDFTAAPMDEWVIYQLHVGTFAGYHDPQGSTGNPSGYRDVGDRAGHLAELGVNAVMVNPINEFPGDFSAGYNPTSMYAWEWKLGTPDDLKYMVDQLHGAGIAVVLDTVWNHFSPTDNFLWDYDGTQIYFDSPTYQDTPWGAQADYDSAGVFEYYVDSVDYTMGEFRMDGYRQDAVMAMTDSGWTGQWSAGQSLMNAMNDVIDARYADAHTIAEIYIDNPWVQTGIGFDTQYHNEFKEALRDAVFDACCISPNTTRVANALDGTGSVSGTDVLNYFELHDDAWPSNGGQRAVVTIDTSAPHDDDYARGRTTLANGLVLFSRGVPAILQGTEWLEDGGWETTRLDWAKKTTYSYVFDYYQALIGLRTTEPALFADSNISVYHVNEAADVIAFERWQNGGKSFVVVANLSNFDRADYRIGLPRAGTWGVVVNNQDAAFGGPGTGTSGTFQTEATSYDGKAQSYALTIPARGFMVLEYDPSTACSVADLDGNGVLNLDDVNAFAVGFLGGDLVADVDGNGVLNLDDINAFAVAFLAGCP
ncbi:MAG: alpha amylase C-terminal domain-containing protein [Phycisphaerales bacterium]